MKNRDGKMAYLVAHYGGRCAIFVQAMRMPRFRGWKKNGDLGIWDFPPTELHHAHAHDTKHHHKVMPLFTDSILNLMPVCEKNHERWRSWGIWSHERCMRAEQFLQRHPKISAWVNNPVGKIF